MERSEPGSGRPLIWMSRTQPAAGDSADRLERLGYDVVVAPLLRVETLGTALDLEGVGSLIFTSRNGVAAFCDRTSQRRFPVFAVGDATAEAARRAGFRQVASAGGAVDDLRRLLLSMAKRGDGAVLRAGAREPAGTLVADLVAAGFDVVDWPAYRTVHQDPQAVVDQVRGLRRDLEAVLVYSPKAARGLSRLLDRQPLPLGRLVCISQAAAAELRDHAAYPMRVAARPNEASLFAALQAESGRP